jgi:hypothetical protein
MAVAQFLEGTAFGVLNDVLSTFRSNEGYALPSRYEVVILPPSGKLGTNQLNIFNNGGSNINTRNVSLRAESVNLPGRTLTTSTDSNIYGPDREVVEGVTFADEISIDFQASSGLDERVFFENWQRQAFNEDNFNVGYYKDYIGEMQIYILDSQDKRRYGLRILEVFPKTVTANQLNYAAASEILKTNVTFSFRYWTNLNQKEQSPDITGRILNTVVRGVNRNILRNIPRILNKL